MPRKPSCSCGECTTCIRRAKKRISGQARYERLKADPEFMERKRAANRKTMERDRRAKGMAPAGSPEAREKYMKHRHPNPLSEEEKLRRRRAQSGTRWERRRREKPRMCALCGTEGPVEGHHPDYSRPRLVTWLCKTCHEKWHHS